jgi:pimeloyl-ACP methyl ester carboxylesterase
MYAILAVVAVLLLLNLLGMYLLQPRITFPRPPLHAQRPDVLAAVGGESIWLDVDGQRVEAWLLPGAARGPAPLLIHVHGNGELIDFWADAFTMLRAAGVHVLLVEFPGYGRSAGDPSEASVTAALVAAYDKVVTDPRVDAQRVVGYGRSLGGGAIAQLVARRAMAALILESSFTSLTDIIRRYYVPDVLIRNRFDTRAVLAAYRGPVLIIHGTTDGIIPVAHARALQAASPRATLQLLPCGHNDCPPQWELVLGFLTANGVCRKPEQESTHEEDHAC